MGLEPMRLDTVLHLPDPRRRRRAASPASARSAARTLGEITVSVAWQCAGSDKDLTEPRQVRRRHGGGARAEVARPRRPQPAARRPVLHGRRQLAPHRGRRIRRRASSACTSSTTTPSRSPPTGSPRSRRGSSPRKRPTRRPSRRARSTAVPLTPSADGPYLEAAIDVGAAAGQPDRAGQLHRGRARSSASTSPSPSTRWPRRRRRIDGATRLAMDIPDDAGGVLGDAARAARRGEGDRRPRRPDRGVGAGPAGQGPGPGPRAARARVPGRQRRAR